MDLTTEKTWTARWDHIWCQCYMTSTFESTFQSLDSMVCLRRAVESNVIIVMADANDTWLSPVPVARKKHHSSVVIVNATWMTPMLVTCKKHHLSIVNATSAWLLPIKSIQYTRKMVGIEKDIQL